MSEYIIDKAVTLNRAQSIQHESELARAYIQLNDEYLKTHKLLTILCEDTTEGFDCLDTCDEYHDELCPLTNPTVAWRQLRQQLNDYKEYQEDIKQLTKQLDIIINGVEGAAKQASLCDIVSQLSILQANDDLIIYHNSRKH